MAKKQERIDSQNRANAIFLLYAQLNRADGDLRVNKKYLDQLEGHPANQLEQDVKTNLSSTITYDSMTHILDSIPQIMRAKWVPIDFEALGL